MWDLIVSVPDHCLSFYFAQTGTPVVPSSKTCIETTASIIGWPFIMGR